MPSDFVSDMFSHSSGSKWIKGANGKTCDQVCTAQGLACDASKQSELTSNEAVAAAFKEAGYVCQSFHGARDYAGVPFSTGRGNADCAPVKPGAKSVCTGNENPTHAALCYCQSECLCMYVLLDGPENTWHGGVPIEHFVICILRSVILVYFARALRNPKKVAPLRQVPDTCTHFLLITGSDPSNAK